jgi:5'-nucleotidase/UDP-sugar diphosphatase
MRLRIRHALILLATLAAAGCGDGTALVQTDAGVDDAGPTTRHLVFFYTSDEHSHLFAFDPEIDDFPLPATAGSGVLVGGAARRAAILDEERTAAAAAGADTLTVSAGDETQGALPQVAFATTAPDFTIMKTMGYDVMCPGNHEFDQGPAAYAAAIAAAQAHGGLPQIVSTNIRFSDTDSADDTLAALYGEGTSTKPIKRYHVVTTASGLKVGFFGILGCLASQDAQLKAPVLFSADAGEEGDSATVMPKLFADITPTIQALREVEQVDVVVALSHSGVDPDVPDSEYGEDYTIGENVAGIDLIISGHTHIPLAEPQIATAPDGYQVPIVQAGLFGAWLGRVELALEPGQRPTLVTDGDATRLIDVDDRTVPTDTTIDDALVDVIVDVEGTPVTGNQSFLEAALSRIEGTPVTDDPNTVGDLYYRVMGKTSFDIPARTDVVETPGFDLITDGMLAAGEELGGPTLAAISGAGVIRADVLAGQTGDLSFADLFRVLPLGSSPADGTIGYPLLRFYLYFAEIKAAMEVSAQHLGGGFFPVPSGLHVYYDTDRAPQVLNSLVDALDPQNGRVTKITADTNHADGLDSEDVVLFDINRTGAEWQSSLGGVMDLHPVVSDLYVASFAGKFGVTLKDENGQEVSLTDAILRRGDQSEVKAYESFISFVQSECAANGGYLPDRYDGSTSAGHVPRRLFCTGSACP